MTGLGKALYQTSQDNAESQNVVATVRLAVSTTYQRLEANVALVVLSSKEMAKYVISTIGIVKDLWHQRQSLLLPVARALICRVQ